MGGGRGIVKPVRGLVPMEGKARSKIFASESTCSGLNGPPCSMLKPGIMVFGLPAEMICFQYA